MLAVKPAFCGSVIHPLSVGPGLTQFAVMPRPDSSLAAAMTIRSSAPFDAP